MTSPGSSLPTLSVQAAFTDGSVYPPPMFANPSTFVWYDITQYVQSFSTRRGRQHELDRTEAGSLTMSLDSRGGQFLPWSAVSFSWSKVGGGSSNFTPSQILTVGVPIKITATWQGTSYPVYFGYTDSWEPSTPDSLNTDITVVCSDAMKHLSTSRLSTNTLYPNLVYKPYAFGQVWNYYRCGDSTTAQGIAEYQGIGLKAQLVGSAQAGVPGPFLYDATTALDLSNGTSPATASGWVLSPSNLATQLTSVNGATVEGWYKNASPLDTLITISDATNGGAWQVALDNNGKAFFRHKVFTSGSPNVSNYTNTANTASLNDGKWHLVTLDTTSVNGTTTFTLAVDGVTAYTSPSQTIVVSSIGWGVDLNGTTSLNIPFPATTATVANLVIHIVTGTSPGYFNDAGTRYATGTYLQTAGEFTGSRIADVLAIVGASNLPTSLASGTVPCASESTTTYTTSALDYLLQFADTEQGYLFIDPSGTVTFYDRFYPQTHASTGITIGDLSSTAAAHYMLGVEVVLDDLDTWTIAQLSQPGGQTTYIADYFPGSPTTTATGGSASGTITVASTTGFSSSGTIYVTINGSVVPVAYTGTTSTTFTGCSNAYSVTIVPGGSAVTGSQAQPYLTKYGPRTYIRSQFWGQRAVDVKAAGQMIVNRYKTPIVRPRKVILENSYQSNNTTYPNMAVMLGLKLWDQVIFQRDGLGTLYSQAVVAESISHDYKATPGSWQTTLILSPYEMNGSSTPDSGSFFRLSDGTHTYSHFAASGQDTFGG
jgi:hypothetical protein